MVNPLIHPQNWMKHLDDRLLLSQLTIPGTHDTCALHGGDLPVCQTLSLKEQFNIGIRALDIRCRHYHNQFPIHHSAFYQHIDFAEVQASCIDFLTANPSETIIMHVKEEYDASGNTETFATTFSEYIFPRAQFWFLGNNVPTIGAVRGKIVLLRRFALDNPNLVMGIEALPWPDNASFAINNRGVGLMIQDQYIVPTIFSIGHKWDLVRNFLNKAATAADKLLFINFTSGASGGAFPNAIAKGFAGEAGINKRLLQFLLALPVQRFGLIYLNFPEYPGPNLVPAIYNLNPFVVAIRKPNPR